MLLTAFFAWVAPKEEGRLDFGHLLNLEIVSDGFELDLFLTDLRYF